MTVLDWLRLSRAAHRHQGGLQRGRLRRLHRGRGQARARPARLPRGQCLHPVRGHPRRLPAAHRRGSEGRGRQAASGAAGDGRLPRLAVRLLHAGLRHVDVRPDPGGRQRCRARRRSTTRWPAISAAAPAMRRSCGRCSRPTPSSLAADAIEAFAGETMARLHALADEETLVVGDGRRRFIAPATVDALAEVLLAEPEATIVAGCTDVGLWVTKQMRRARSDRLSRPRARAAADRGDRRRHRRSAPGVSHSDAMAALAPLLSGPGRDVAPVRLGADPQCRHGRRQHRQRLADRRRHAVADRRRRHAAAAPRRRAAHPAARGFLHRLRQAGPRARASSSRASRCRGRRRARATAPTRSASASTRTSRR